MIRLIRFLWTGSWHEHEWENLGLQPIVDEDGDRIGNKYHLRCKHCGWMTGRRV